MQLTIPTIDEIRAAIRDEFSAFLTTNHLQSQPKPQDDFGGIELAIELTGLAKPTIYGLVSERKIPHSKRGKKLYFERQELLQWVKQGKRKTQSELNIEAEKFDNNGGRRNAK